MSALYGADAYSPSEIARRIESVGVAKARLATLPLLTLGGPGGEFEHSIANMYLMPLAMLIQHSGATVPAADSLVGWFGMFGHLLPVIAAAG